MAKQVRKPDVVVVSDFHLATHACKATEIHKYLKSILPKKLILNGDIIDAWRFSRNYFPKPHLKVVRQLIKMMEKGTEVVYVTGNHDEFLRELGNTTIGKLRIVDQITLNLNNRKTLIFHGDLIDNVIHKAKWLAKFGAAAYGLVTLFNKLINLLLKTLRVNNIILFKWLKELFGNSHKENSKFETKLAKLAYDKDVDTIICGHTHIAVDKVLLYNNRLIRYINTGDWVENFTAAEFENGNWTLCNYAEIFKAVEANDTEPEDFVLPSKKELYAALLNQLAFNN
ncbi:UDP-2,3-diacylglucosamine diphosphatase [Draconibacterium sp. IB214405]|uniref:UDP-2,3-diacylglucosamine diphosphatase n=1 Tax=Draconibacterium sp. IB214405 TaxID=3097352 RepID=UPI002A130253|nr:UDP-2,3-diacylglucosamine diphosphatase [Draconibacterium sp. IB214405]MDX8338622.1 UDP-2,3-diacylglucosamine diphosphatase [Draconibacterium sp. IB214405]